MLFVLLKVLKVIGITLLVLLGVILISLLLILFVPVRYRLDGLVPETDPDNGFDMNKFMFSARFSWLLHIVSGGIELPKNKEFYVKVFGFKLFSTNKVKNDKKKDNADSVAKTSDNENRDQKEEKGNEKEIDSDNNSEVVSEEENAIIDDTSLKDAITNNFDEKDMIIEDSAKEGNDAEEAITYDNDTEDVKENNRSENRDSCNNETDEQSQEANDKAAIEIFYDIVNKIKRIIETPQNVLSKIRYTISRVCDKIGMIKTTLDNEIFKRAYDVVKDKFIRMMKMILPDKVDIDLKLGMGDPADTANIISVYGMMYPVLYDKVRLSPDFDRKVVYADAHLKGHITMFTVLYCAGVCYFNKDVKKVIKRFKKIMKS
ncbi:DUF2953 domain-containing protein [Butyrivibrio sp. YAB3001]|uniref:DUF2953 domain-containing protein n=1 Tax=Butyrivibrio sp. YAB3001 TaxID=1520812 RepID=UPI0008F65CCF|nr:DUF2953 domain-containing protein [Butyrivibrio sp. YAB3001]SFC35868.1 hypothetical protein SAMN02910398_02091 [Butyrivibrio sp. YAB3001]